MKRGFFTIMTAQFFSSLADNALFIAAIALLKADGAPAWQASALVPMFALFYVVFAPFVGAYADARHKRDVMFASNGIKVLGCLLMLLGFNPVLSYAIVGLGAAAYSPAKYGILTELLPPSQLVKANGWIEGLTIASIILGVVLGGQLIGPHVAPVLLSANVPWVHAGIDTPAEAAIAVLMVLYAIAAWFNKRIPLTGVALRGMPSSPLVLMADFARGNRMLWRDKLGQISLATTTLFWGASGNLRYIVLAWAAVALHYDTTQASNLVGVVAIGTALGALASSVRVPLHRATSVMPLGIGLGLLVLVLNWVRQVDLAVVLLALLGGLGGYLVVPMNALLQHRGHSLMGAGCSIAVQNFNEQACILALGGLYTLSTGMGVSAFTAITLFGLLVALLMALIQHWHRSNLRRYPDQVQPILAQLSQDPHE